MRQSVDEFAAPRRAAEEVRARAKGTKRCGTHTRARFRLRMKPRCVFRETEQVSLRRLLAGKGVRPCFAVRASSRPFLAAAPFSRPRLVALIPPLSFSPSPPSNLFSHNSRHGVTRGSRAQPLNSRSSFQPRISQPEVPSTRIKPSASILDCFPLCARSCAVKSRNLTTTLRRNKRGKLKDSRQALPS